MEETEYQGEAPDTMADEETVAEIESVAAQEIVEEVVE